MFKQLTLAGAALAMGASAIVPTTADAQRYRGGYDRFEETRRMRLELDEKRRRKQDVQRAHIQAFVDRFRYKASKARQAQSRQKQVEKLEERITDPPKTSRRAPTFRFTERRKSGADVLVAEGLHKSFGDKTVLTGVSLTVRRGERVGIIGANGLGKSTLLKILVGKLAPDQGSATWGYEAHPGYFAQDHGDHFEDPSMTVLDFLWNSCPEEPTTFVRGQLGALLFSGEDVDKRLVSLSGGEAARLIMSRIIVQKPNVLVLDEPTNHLDLEAIEALLPGLAKYPGTLIFVSHDRHFVSELATRIIELRPDGISDYAGTFAEYLAHQGDDHLDLNVAMQKKKQAASASVPPPKVAMSASAPPPKLAEGFEDRKKRRSKVQKLTTQRERVTADIDRVEQRLRRITESYCEPGFFEKTPKVELAALEAEEAQLKPQLERLMGDWEAVEAELAVPES